MTKIYFLLLAFGCSIGLNAQIAKDSTKAKTPAPTKKWYESIQLRGYMQESYNGLLQKNEEIECEKCDKS